jgi:hypothetical protein
MTDTLWSAAVTAGCRNVQAMGTFVADVSASKVPLKGFAGAVVKHCDCVKAMRGRIALQKHFVRNRWNTLVFFGESFRSAYASSRRFLASRRLR